MHDWVAWHSGYDDPRSPLRARLDRVTWHLGRATTRRHLGRFGCSACAQARAATCCRFCPTIRAGAM